MTGLLCPASDSMPGTCRADAITLDDVVLRSGEAAGLCTAAARLVVRGSVRFAVEWASGIVLGLLPVVVSTWALPPVPLPYVRLTQVRGWGVSLNADELRGLGMVLGWGSQCAGPPGGG
ncbi:hypothetical protein [Kitasatospora sp. NPDC058046]|uniref:hypothetical protein n=1 Tax=Kitasatospora sp. NPDC058046 TaxID=3346312 RepID=UPI0036DE9E2F